MKLALRIILLILIVACILRGVMVFDMGGSAVSSYPTASAICFVGGTIAMAIMYFAESKSN